VSSSLDGSKDVELQCVSAGKDAQQQQQQRKGGVKGLLAKLCKQ
jgi:hypothetical protein